MKAKDLGAGMRRNAQKCFASGGKVHSDVAQDKALIRKMVKKEDLKMAVGGSTKIMHGVGTPQGAPKKPSIPAASQKMTLPKVKGKVGIGGK